MSIEHSLTQRSCVCYKQIMKKIIFLTLSILCVLILSSNAFSFGGCEENCLKCHKLSKSDAEKVLKPMVPDVQVSSVRMSPAKGLWEIALTSGGKKGIAYVDFSLDNVIVGSIVQIKTKVNLTQERMMEISKVDVSQVNLDHTLTMGSEDAAHRIIVFDDPD
jgi:thiol:disulfide interchange protein DsbC